MRSELIRSGLSAIFFLLLVNNAGSARNRAYWIAPTSDFVSSSNLVLVNASVEDTQGRPITDLDPNAFRLFDDGREQALVSLSQSDIPVSMIIDLDSSSSMRNLASRAARSAAVSLEGSNPGDEFALVTFADRPSLAVGWTGDNRQIRDYLPRVQSHGNTALLDSMVYAASIAKRAKNAQRVIIVISDGIDNHSRRSIASVQRLLLEANVHVYAINILNSEGLYTATQWDNDEVLDPICESTGGRVIQVLNSTDLLPTLAAVAREIRSEYVLGFRPTALTRPGKYHRIRLMVKRTAGSRLSVSWRRGYYEP
ncbi:MAG: VWA domain-containing protein [Bryobacteraceae bacterium]